LKDIINPKMENVKGKIGRPAFGGIPKKAGQITRDLFIVVVVRSNVIAR